MSELFKAKQLYCEKHFIHTFKEVFCLANAVIMPKAGITVESCIIGKWEKNVGDSVKVGDILFTYETDKASFE